MDKQKAAEEDPKSCQPPGTRGNKAQKQSSGSVAPNGSFGTPRKRPAASDVRVRSSDASATRSNSRQLNFQLCRTRGQLS